MPTTIKLKNSVTTTNTPASLAQGEVAINITDKKVWVGNAATTPIQLLGAGGSASFSALTCTSLTNSGLTSGRVTYATTAGLLTDSANLTFNGTTLTAASLTSTGVATFSAGTVSAPALTTTGDTNTGIFFPAADTIAFTEGGVESMRIDSSGNVGIGTASPNIASGFTNFVVSDTDNGGIVYVDRVGGARGYFYANGTSSVVLGNTSSIPLVFTTADTERMRIDSSGRLLQGTTSSTAYVGPVTNANWATVFSASDSSTSFTSSIGNVAIDNPDTTANNYSRLAFTTNDGTNRVVSAGLYAQITARSAGNWTTSNLQFYTGTTGGAPTEKMRITSGGDIQIATTGVYIRLKSASTDFDISGQAGATDFLRINANTTQRFQFDALGRAYNSTGTWGTISDARLKENIADATPKLDSINQLRVVNFNFRNEPDVKQIGFIAQEVEQVFPGLVSEGESDGEGGYYKAVKTTVLIPMLVKAIQEQQAMIEELKQEVAKLKGV